VSRIKNKKIIIINVENGNAKFSKILNIIEFNIELVSGVKV
jgi:hypothetical protein